MTIMRGDQAMARMVDAVARKRPGWARNIPQLGLSEDFCWNEECETSFQGLKKYLASCSYCQNLLERDTFSLLMVSESAISEALVWKDEGIQMPVYYASHSMNDA